MVQELSWADFKTNVDSRSLSVNYFVEGIYYKIFAYDGPLKLRTSVEIEDPASADQTDFETNYMPSSNKNIIQRTLGQTAPVPVSIRPQGDAYICPANQKTTFYFPFSETYRMRGAEFMCVNGKAFDKVKCWVTDKDGAVYAAGTRLTEYVPGFAVYEHIPGTSPELVDLIDEDTSDPVPSVFYLEFEYDNQQAAGSDDVIFIINFWMYVEGSS